MALISNGTTIASGGSLSVSTTPTTAQVLSATASASAGAVGSYAMIANEYWSTSNEGTTFNANLRFSNANAGHNNRAPSGTWRLMGTTQGTSTGRSHTSVMLRIS